MKEESARLAAERMAFAANALHALIAYVDTSRRYVWINDAYCRWFGCSREEILGRRPDEVLDAAAWAAVKPHTERALAGEEVAFDNRVVPSGGASRDVRASYVPHRDDSGRICGFVALVTDITETKAVEVALRRSERLLKQSQAAAQVGSWEVTFDQNFSELPGSYFWSSETYRIFGVDPSTPASLSLFYSRVHPDELPAMLVRARPSFVRGETFQSDYRIVRPDGDVRMLHSWLNFESGPDGTVHVFGTCQDITERKRADVEIHRALNDLREVDRRKDEFLAMLSHELRNPLAPILNAVEVLQHLQPGDEHLASQNREIIARQAKHMRRLLDDLMDVSRVSRGEIQLQKQRFDLNVLLGQAVEVSRPMMIEKGHQLSMTLAPQPVELEADPTRLLQVFDNLLSNAAKYTDPGGHIAIVVAVGGDEAVVTVRDDGIGMTPDLLARAFDLFVQGTRSLDRSQGGLGIGLTLVQTLVRMLGGSVRAASQGPGRGSQLVVTLPLAPPAQLQPAPEAAAPRAGAGAPLRVLVVDDNVDAAKTLGQLLKLTGHEVSLAHDGPAALAAAVAAPPDLVLLDIGLPGMDGYAVAARLRAAGNAGTTLVALTGYGRDNDLQRSRDAGFDHHLVKPIDFGQLQRILLQVRSHRSWPDGHGPNDG